MVDMQMDMWFYDMYIISGLFFFPPKQHLVLGYSAHNRQGVYEGACPLQSEQKVEL